MFTATQSLIGFTRLIADYEQSEYPIAYALVAAMVLLGMLAICVPRFRKAHFVEPEETQDKSKSGKRKGYPTVSRSK